MYGTVIKNISSVVSLAGGDYEYWNNDNNNKKREGEKFLWVFILNPWHLHSFYYTIHTQIHVKGVIAKKTHIYSEFINF